MPGLDILDVGIDLKHGSGCIGLIEPQTVLLEQNPKILEQGGLGERRSLVAVEVFERAGERVAELGMIGGAAAAAVEQDIVTNRGETAGAFEGGGPQNPAVGAHLMQQADGIHRRDHENQEHAPETGYECCTKTASCHKPVFSLQALRAKTRVYSIGVAGSTVSRVWDGGLGAGKLGLADQDSTKHPSAGRQEASKSYEAIY